MKYIKTLGLLIVAAVAMMVFAASASAITITEAPGDHIDVGDVVRATSTHVELTTPVIVTCKHSFLEFTITNPGGTHSGTTTTAKANVNNLTFGECGPTTITVISGGTLELHRIAVNKASLTSSGLVVTKLTHSFFIGTTHCISQTNNTNIGSVSENTLSIESAPIPQVATDGLCGEEAEWHGKYIVTQPTGLVIH